MGDFWAALDELIDQSEVVIDRPAGSTHPRFDEFTYPLDYGFLEGTAAIDGGGIDVWRGSLAGAGLVAVIAMVDTYKRDAEIKLLIDCTDAECELVLALHNRFAQSAIIIYRPAE